MRLLSEGLGGPIVAAVAVSRRRFLYWTSGGVASLAAAFASIRALSRLRAPGTPEEPSGALSAAALDVLLALPDALVDHDVERSHYESYYRFSAETLTGYRTIYERFAGDADAVAKRRFGKRFSEASRAERRTVLRALRIPRNRFSQPFWLFNPWPVRYHHYIIVETLEMYDDTDAWIALGYGAWPGMPRTLDLLQTSPEVLLAQARLRP